MQFTYGGRIFKTEVHDDAGKHAIFNETMILEDVSLFLDKMLAIEAYDEDTISNKYLGITNGLKFDTLVKKSEV